MFYHWLKSGLYDIFINSVNNKIFDTFLDISKKWPIDGCSDELINYLRTPGSKVKLRNLMDGE